MKLTKRLVAAMLIGSIIVSPTVIGIANAAGKKPNIQKKVVQKSKGSKKVVGLLCTWVAFETEKETFILNPNDRSLYWVNQNQKLSIKQLNHGRLVAEGTRNRIKVGRGKFKEKVPVRMIFDRVSGDYVMLQTAYKIQSIGSCQRRRLF